MNTFTVDIPLTPKPKASYRLSAWGGKYNPSAKGMKQVRDYVEKEMQKINQPRMKGPLLVIVHFRLPPPSTYTHAERNKIKTRLHHKRPDGDNLEKFLNDALNGLLWVDDALIAIMLRTKSYGWGREGSTTLFVRELNSDEFDYLQIMKDIETHLNIEAA